MARLPLFPDDSPRLPDVQAGRDEMNFAEFPLVLLTDRVPIGLKGKQSIRYEYPHGALTVSGSDAYGLPTAADADVLVGLIQLTRKKNDFQDPKVHFTRYELLKVLRWPDEGKYYRRLDESLNRWSGVTLYYDNTWWDNRAKKHLTAKLHVIETVMIDDKATGRSQPQPFSYFVWNKTFIESCQADNLKRLDLDTYFGFRKVAIENGRFYLNNRPVYLKFVLDQGYWPDSLLTPPSDEAIKFDIEKTLEMGFNGARKHQKLEDPRFLYWADKMGFLVSSEMANAYLFDEQYAFRFMREWKESVLRDMNHPSIVMWVPINESWGVPNLRDPRQQAHLRALYHATKTLDPSRPVIGNDGWENLEATDLMAVHDYTARGPELLARWQNVEVKPGATLPSHSRGYVIPGFEYNGTPLYLSEFGGIAYIPEGVKVPESAWGYDGVEKSQADALARLQGLYEAIRDSPFIGICYTQITDVEQEINGLLTYDRKPKFDPAAIKKLNDMLR